MNRLHPDYQRPVALCESSKTIEAPAWEWLLSCNEQEYF